MHRPFVIPSAARDLQLLVARAALIVLALAACTGAPARDTDTTRRGFTSDRISVTSRGQGPDIVLVHGLGADRDVWAAVADSMDERYTVHGVQIHGFGGAQAGANADGPVVAPVAEEVARYIRETRPAGAAIVGHSLGGAVAMMVAARHPALVTKVMAVDAPPFIAATFTPPGTPADSIRAMADGIRANILDTTAKGNSMFEQMVGTMTRVDSMKAVLLRMARASHRPTVANAMHELILTDLRPELGKITAPLTALYVVPANLPMKPAQFDGVVRGLFANAPTARLVRIDNSNHYIMLDQPARFVREVDEFMRR